ncbi:MAG: hypothetical protein RBS37_02935 [Bacteroidales bacterium]|jgi:hypothetical protein|nr:hypothetical protein [Bacteroidales bacterium]
MKRTLFLLLFIIPALHAECQYFQGVRGLRSGVYAEAFLTPREFSNGIISLNYEHFFGRKYNYSLRAGILPDFRSSICFPITLSYITKPYGSHHLEIGAGLVSMIDFFEGMPYHDIAAGIFPLMYRYTGKGRFYFRGGLNIFYSWPVLPTPSFSLGYRF